MSVRVAEGPSRRPSATCVSVGAVQAGELDVVLPGIGPVDAVVYEVQREAVGPRDLVLHDDAAVGAVHPDSANVRVVSPVGPVQVPERVRGGEGCYGTQNQSG